MPALRAADVAAAVPLMKEAIGFGDTPDPALIEAQALYATLETSVLNANATAEAFASLGREPAVEVLVACARSLEEPVNLNKNKAVRLSLKGANYKGWQRALKTIAPLHRKVGGRKPWNTMDEVLAKLDALPGAFIEEMRADLAHARDANDTAELARILDGAKLRPAIWLLERHFHYQPAEG